MSKYTREAGVRGLERKLGTLCRAAAVYMANQKSTGKAEEQNHLTRTDMLESANEKDNSVKKVLYYVGSLAVITAQLILYDNCVT